MVNRLFNGLASSAFNGKRTITKGELLARGHDLATELETSLGTSALDGLTTQQINELPVNNNLSSGLLDQDSMYVKEENDHRIRISAKATEEEKNRLYGSKDDTSNLLYPLHYTDGLLFPFTPTISATFNSNYSSLDPVHSIQDFQTYKNTSSSQFSITGMFVAQTPKQARYAIAAIHFLRTVTKMTFGQLSGNTGDKLGMMPPTLRLNGYGTYMFNNLPIIITNYNIELTPDIDYVRVVISKNANKEIPSSPSIDYGDFSPPASQQQQIRISGDGDAWVPSKFNITCNCVVQHTPSNLRKFDMGKFRSGELLKDRKRSGGNANKDIGGWW